MEAWYSTNPLAKRPRFENTSLPIYPQRPGEKDCAHYMQTRTCKFGEGCKFDHPIWVPDGGIPDWKEVTAYYYILCLYTYSFIRLYINKYKIVLAKQLIISIPTNIFYKLLNGLIRSYKLFVIN